MTALEILRFGLARHREESRFLYSPIKAKERGVQLPNEDDDREHGIACAALSDAQDRLYGTVALDQAKRITIYEVAIASLEQRAVEASKNPDQLDLFGGAK